jgi:hypothetical protein
MVLPDEFNAFPGIRCYAHDADAGRILFQQCTEQVSSFEFVIYDNRMHTGLFFNNAENPR